MTRSLTFGCRAYVSQVDDQRPDEGFGWIPLRSARITLEQQGIGRNRLRSLLAGPFGRECTAASAFGVLSGRSPSCETRMTQPSGNRSTEWWCSDERQEAGSNSLSSPPQLGTPTRFPASIGHRRSCARSHAAGEAALAQRHRPRAAPPPSLGVCGAPVSRETSSV